MEYTIKPISQIQQPYDCLVLGFFKDNSLCLKDSLDEKSQRYIHYILEKQDVAQSLGRTLPLYLDQGPGVSPKCFLFVCCGEKSPLTSVDFRKVVNAAAMALKTMPVKRVASYLADIQVQGLDFEQRLKWNIGLIEDSFYQFNRFKTGAMYHPISIPEEFIFNLSRDSDKPNAEKIIQQSVALNEGVKFTKDLANLPANICTPRYVAQQAEDLAKEYPNLLVSCLDEASVKDMGAFLAVAKGSQEPARFVVLTYGEKFKGQRKPVVLIGKGVTFDAGGISLKPAAGMEEMKFDMSGAASVLGILKTIAQLNLPIFVIGLMPLTENLPSGTASKPGDIVTTLSGQTVEILNTDAEGRLILADALTYSQRFDPDVVIDIATLTGAIVVALGSLATGLMSNDASLTKELEQASQQSYDRVWSLPLWEEYQEQIDSNVADIANVGVDGAKSITAACFLSRFAKPFRWAHLDIAGTAWKKGKDKMATGRPVSLLVQFLLNRCRLAESDAI